MKKKDERMLKLWKARQEAEGHDVSAVKTLKDAEQFFAKKKRKASPKKPKGA